METNKNILKEIYKKRPINSKKYDYGIMLVIGGSDFYSGSPALSSLAGFKTGVDMIRIIAPERAANIIASFGPDLAAYPLKGDILTKEHLSILKSITKTSEIASHGKISAVIGGGLGRTEEIKNSILGYISSIDIPAVIDADAIYAVAKNPKVISGKPFLITPHLYEFYILTGKEVYDLSEEEKIELVKSEAKRLKTTILLKGSTDIISNGEEVLLNTIGSPLMTKGGMGDTLAGIAGAIMARDISPIIAGQAAAFINGSAGKLAGEKLGESIMATDLINEIPNVIKDI